MDEWKRLIKAEKDLFFVYTGIDVSDIEVEIVNEIKNGAYGKASARVKLKDDVFAIEVSKECVINSDFSNLSVVWHEIMHCVDIRDYIEIFGSKNKKEMLHKKEFVIWTEFHSYYISKFLYIKFMNENQGISEGEIRNSLDDILRHYKKYLKEKYLDTKNTTVYSLLYSYALFYGQYLAYIKFLENKMLKCPKDLCYDYRITKFTDFLYNNIAMPKERSTWRELDEIINLFGESDEMKNSKKQSCPLDYVSSN